jgi:hypothetical protein
MNQQKIRAEINGDARCGDERLLFRVRFHKRVIGQADGSSSEIFFTAFQSMTRLLNGQ